METSCDAVLVVDAATGTVVDCNASACRLLDTTSGQLIGAHHTTFYPPELRAEYDWHFEQLASGATASTVERQLLLRNGETVWVEASGSISEAEGRRLVLGILRDIRGQRSARDELRCLNKILLATSACDEAIMQAADQTQLHAHVTQLLVEANICRLAALVCFHKGASEIVAQSSVDGLALEEADLPVLGKALDWPGPGAPVALPARMLRYPGDALPAWPSWARTHGAEPGSLVSLPIECSSGERGALLLVTSESEAFQPGELGVLGRLADHLRNGLDMIRARLERTKALDTVRYRLSFEAILTSAIQEFFHIAGHDVDALVQGVWEKISRFLVAEHSFCILFSGGGLPESRFEWHGESAASMTGAVIDMLTSASFSWSQNNLRNGTAVLVGPDDPGFAGPRSELELCRGLGIRSMLLVPIVDEGQLAGVEGFYARSQSCSWAEEDVDMLKLAGQIILGTVRRANSARLLEESENRLRMVLDAASNGVFDLDFSTDRIFYGENWARMLGYEPREIVSTREASLALVHPDDVAGIDRAFQEHLSGGKPQFEAEFRLRNREGEWQWVLSRGKVVEWDKAGQPLRLLGIHIDIADRKRAESALQWRDARHRALLEAMPDTLLRVRRDGEVLDAHVSDQAPLADMLRTALGQRLFEVFPDVVAEQAMHNIRRALDQNQTQVFEFRMDVAGREDAFEARTVLTDHSEAILIIRDVSERHRLEREILEVSERERGRIGQDLHDGLGQELVGVGFLVNALSTELERGKSPLANSARSIAGLVAEALEHSRLLARGLHVVGLEDDGLGVALEELVSRTRSVYEVDGKFSSRGVIWLPAEEANQMYRIAQEAVTNAVRHANPSCIFVSLLQNERRVRLAIEDDGVGFDHRAITHEGMGLNIMRYRARVVSASLQIDSEPGHGTRVVVTLPLSRNV